MNLTNLMSAWQSFTTSQLPHEDLFVHFLAAVSKNPASFEEFIKCGRRSSFPEDVRPAGAAATCAVRGFAATRLGDGRVVVSI